VIVERGTKTTLSRQGRGRAHYLNLSPLEYWDDRKRFSGYGEQWRKIIGPIFEEAGIFPKVVIKEEGGQAKMIETIFWENGDDLFLGMIKNPTDKDDAISGDPARITLHFRKEVGLFDVKNQKDLGRGNAFPDVFNPWEANFYRVSFSKGTK
jgi:hypothetical protein